MRLRLDALSGTAGYLSVMQHRERCWSAVTESGAAPDARSEEGRVSAWQFFKAM